MSPMGLWISDVSACAVGWSRKQLREVSPTTLLSRMIFYFILSRGKEAHLLNELDNSFDFVQGTQKDIESRKVAAY